MINEIRYIFLISISMMERVEVHKYILQFFFVIKRIKSNVRWTNYAKNYIIIIIIMRKHLNMLKWLNYMVVLWKETWVLFSKGKNKTLLTDIGRFFKLTSRSIVAIVSINYAAFVGLIAFDLSCRFDSFASIFVFVLVFDLRFVLFLYELAIICAVNDRMMKQLIGKLHFSKAIEFSQKHVSH